MSNLDGKTDQISLELLLLFGALYPQCLRVHGRSCNVPCLFDDEWTKVGRKAKWMLITILFPEFAFSRSICELQLAVDDLHAMKEKEDVVELGVRYGPGLKLLHKLFNCLGSTHRPITISGTKSDHEPTVTSRKERHPVAEIITQPGVYSCGSAPSTSKRV